MYKVILIGSNKKALESSYSGTYEYCREVCNHYGWKVQSYGGDYEWDLRIVKEEI